MSIANLLFFRKNNDKIEQGFTMRNYFGNQDVMQNMFIRSALSLR